LLQGRFELPSSQQPLVDVLEHLLEQGAGDEHLPVFSGQLRPRQEHHF
jgi:hypothetical protein